MSRDPLGLLVAASVAITFALVVVLVLRRPLRRRAGAEAAYALWWLPPLATVAALLPSGDGALRALAFAAMPGAATQLLQVAGHAVAQRPAAPLLTLWLAGALAAALVRGVQHVRFRRGLGRRLRARIREGAAGPCISGLWRPVIVLPARFRADYDVRERRLVLAHEIAHWRRGDLAANALAALLRCVFWFHPLLHLAAARFRLDQELACDARVLHRFPEARRRYAGAMLKPQLDAAEATDGLDAPGWGWRNDHPLKERILMLTVPPAAQPARLRGRVTVGVLAAAIAATVWAAQPLAARSAGFVDATITLRSADASHRARMINPFGEPFLVTTVAAGQDWQAEFVARPESAESIRLSARITRGGDVVATPEVVLRDGEPGAVTLEGAAGIPGLTLDLTVRRSDRPTPLDAGEQR